MNVATMLNDADEDWSEAEDRYYASLADEEDYRNWRWERHVESERTFQEEVRGHRRFSMPEYTNKVLGDVVGLTSADDKYRVSWPEHGPMVGDKDYTPEVL